jgi:hypothetical protein
LTLHIETADTKCARVSALPRRECSQLWFDQSLAKLLPIELTLLIGQHARRHCLGNGRTQLLLDTEKSMGRIRST